MTPANNASARRDRTRRPRYDVTFYAPLVGQVLTPQMSAHPGGGETQIYLLAQALADQGLRVCLVVFNQPGELPRSVGDVDILARAPYKPHTQRLGRLREPLAIFRALSKVQTDVIVTRSAGPEVGFVGLAAKLWRSRMVYSSANVTDFNHARMEPKWLNRVLYRLGIGLCNEIVVQTHEQATLCQRSFRRSAKIIPSIAQPAGDVACKPEAFLWAGRITWYKRPLAFVELARALPNARFCMVGLPVPVDDPGLRLASQLQQAAQEVSNLELIPPCSRSELLARMDRAVAIVNTADFEGMPNVFLEGWARGVPALALSHDPDGVIDRHGLGGFAAGSSIRLAELAQDLWDKREAIDWLADRCREYVANYHSCEAVSEGWLETVLDGSARRPADVVRLGG